MRQIDKDRERIISSIERRNELYQEVDGFWVWTPSGGGFIQAYELRWIADELDKRNKPIQEEINKYFDEVQKHNKEKG